MILIVNPLIAMGVLASTAATDAAYVFFNAATFAGSFMLLLGVLSPEILKAIGNLKPYLLFAGFTGLSYTLWALFSR